MAWNSSFVRSFQGPHGQTHTHKPRKGVHSVSCRGPPAPRSPDSGGLLVNPMAMQTDTKDTRESRGYLRTQFSCMLLLFISLSLSAVALENDLST